MQHVPGAGVEALPWHAGRRSFRNHAAMIGAKSHASGLKTRPPKPCARVTHAIPWRGTGARRRRLESRRPYHARHQDRSSTPRNEAMAIEASIQLQQLTS